MGVVHRKSGTPLGEQCIRACGVSKAKRRKSKHTRFFEKETWTNITNPRARRKPRAKHTNPRALRKPRAARPV